jgi:Mor family transcriptional regulator
VSERSATLRGGTEKQTMSKETKTAHNEPTDEEMAACFGTKTKCDRKCPMKALCKDEAKEKTEEARRKQFRETPFIDEMDADSDEHHANRRYLIGKDSEGDEASPEEIVRAIEMLEVPERTKAALKAVCKRHEANEKARDATKEMLARLGELYVFDPQGFEALFFQVLNGCNQSTLARMHQCSKQNISKKLVKGKERLETHRARVAMNGAGLSGRDLGIYFYVYVKKFSQRKTASILGIGKSTVSNVVKKLAKQKFAVAKKTHLARAVKVFRKKTAGEPLSETEQSIYHDIIHGGKSVRELAKRYRCSVSTVVSLRKQNWKWTKNASQ